MNLFKTKMTAVDDSRVTTVERKRVSWNHGLKGCFSDDTLKLISERLKNHDHRQSVYKDPAYQELQRQRMKNSEAARVARLASRAQAEATKRANGYYDNRQPKVQQPKVKQPRQLQAEKGGKGLREGAPMGTPLMTPEGLFESRAAYIRHTGLTGATISQRIKQYPQHYFYLA